MYVKPTLSHLLDLSNLSADCISYVLERAKSFHALLEKNNPLPQLLSGKKILNLFYEPSTRTQYSFEIAANNLGATVISPNMSNLSSNKGESLLDTFFSFEAMGVNLFIVRHSSNNTPHFIANEIKTNTKIINAGDGTAHHPTQALIDLFTIQSKLSTLTNLNIAILGDVAHSRVAKSLIRGLRIMGENKICLIGPKDFIQVDSNEFPNLATYNNLKEGLQNVDVIVCLRLQQERIADSDVALSKGCLDHFSLTEDSLHYANPQAIILHPGPINRGVEIDSRVADGDQSQLLTQVRNSIPVRMAILELLLDC